MAEQKESSVLFSLKELMNLEEDRIKQEDEEKRRRADADVQARVDAERRAREQELARLNAEEERKLRDEQRKKEDAARLEAIRHAEVEKARVEAEQRARMESLSKQQEHERALSSLKHDEHKKKLQRMVMLSIGGAVLLLVAVLGIYLGKIKPETEAREAAAQAAYLQQADEAKKLQHQLEEQSQKVNDLVAKLSSAQDQKQRDDLRNQLQDEQNKRDSLIKRNVERNVGGGGGTSPRPASKPCACQPGDPLCSCL